MSIQGYPVKRLRRLRGSETIRGLVRETRVTPADLIYPVFVEEKIDAPKSIASMPGIFRQTENGLGDFLKTLRSEGIHSVLLFGVSHNKDAAGGDSLQDNGLLARMLKRAKDACPDMLVIADLCFCEYTDHGHCGPLDAHGDVRNDATLENLQKQAVIAAQSGADVLAPSGMMDGMVQAIRAAADSEGFENVPVMSYASKFASSFYGPFREAAGCSLGKSESGNAARGDRKTYQLDPANARQALLEAALDEAEGADILMVKPAMPYLDILAKLKERTDLPLAAYQVSGEYAMIKCAGETGALDEKAVMLESLTAIKRAGADIILTYYAREAIKALR